MMVFGSGGGGGGELITWVIIDAGEYTYDEPDDCGEIDLKFS